MTTRILLRAAVLAVLLAAPAAARAAVPLRWAPADTTVAAGAAGRLTVVVDDTLSIRTIDVTVAYDTTVVRSLGGAAGTLFTAGGLQLFRGFEEPEPGTWHGYCVIMGSGDDVTGPGELFTWDFAGVVDGVSPIATVTVYLSNVDGDWYPDVTLEGTTVTVGDGLSTVPAAPRAGALRLAPNPFNPRTVVGADLPAAGPVRLTVHDLRGGLVAVLWDGAAGEGTFARAWDGRDRRGRALPGGTYLFRLETPGAVLGTKGLLLK